MRLVQESGANSSVLLPNLKKLERWVCWKPKRENGELRKIPANVNENTGQSYQVSYLDSENWYTYDEAKRICGECDDVAGISIVIDDRKDDFVILDLDDCVNPETGKIDKSVSEYLKAADTYTEISPSGTGLHVVFRGSIPRQGWPAPGDDMEGEIYRRYIITVTERHVLGTPYKAKRNDDLLEKVFDENDIRWRELFYKSREDKRRDSFGTPQL